MKALEIFFPLQPRVTVANKIKLQLANSLIFPKKAAHNIFKKEEIIEKDVVGWINHTFANFKNATRNIALIWLCAITWEMYMELESELKRKVND